MFTAKVPNSRWAGTGGAGVGEERVRIGRRVKREEIARRIFESSWIVAAVLKGLLSQLE